MKTKRLTEVDRRPSLHSSIALEAISPIHAFPAETTHSARRNSSRAEGLKDAHNTLGT
jgi:hypothetical protein